MNARRNAASCRRNQSNPVARFERLEDRQLFTVILPTPIPIDPIIPTPVIPSLGEIRVSLQDRELSVQGGIFDDTVEIAQSSGWLTLKTSTAGGPVTARSFLRSDVDLVRVNGNSGNDTLTATWPFIGDRYRPAVPQVTVRMEIDGGTGDDRIHGGEANDTLRGGDGNDTFYSSAGADVYQGGAGAGDLLNRNDATGALRITLDGVANDGLSGEYDNVYGDVETVWGGRFDDYLSNLTGANRVFFAGNGGNDVLYGGPESDTLNGGEGNDTLYGRSGNDTLVGMGGDDRAYGGTGDDTFMAGAWAGADGTTITVGLSAAPGTVGQSDVVNPDVEHLVGSANADTIYGSIFAEEIRGGAGDDNIHGNGGSDRIFGDAGNDRLYGGEWDDAIDGGPGNDTLYGRGGNDTLNGGDGNDTLFGQAGLDVMNGGNGDDILIALGGGMDRTDGGAGEDVYWLDAIDRFTPLSANERRQHFLNRVRRFNNGAGLEPAGEAIANPAPDREATWGDFSANPVFAQPASMNDVRQGAVGDCWWSAATAGVARYNPDYLRGMVVPLGDGTFGIRLDDQFYRIDGQLPVGADGQPLYARLAADGGTWVGLLEKAMVLHRGTGLPHNNNQYGRLNLGTTGEGFGNFGFEDQNKHYWPGDFGWVMDQLAQGRAVTVCTGFVGIGIPLIPFHCYNIVSAYRDASGTGYLYLRNPWGHDHSDPRHIQGADDGYLAVRFDDVAGSAVEFVACRTSY